MIRSFTARNFRCFQDFTIDSLERVNLIVGSNNVGKTALLEAIWVHHGRSNPELGIRVNSFRGMNMALVGISIDRRAPMSDLFFNFDRDTQIELEGQGDWGDGPKTLHVYIEAERRYEAPLVPQILPGLPIPPGLLGIGGDAGQGASPLSNSTLGQAIVFHYTDELGDEFESRAIITETGVQFVRAPMPLSPAGVFLASRHRSDPMEDVDHFGKLEVSGREKDIVGLLAHVEPRLKRLAVIVLNGSPTLHGDIGMERLVPLPLMGDGIGRLLSMGLAIANVPGGVVLVDEFENGLYYAAMRSVWKGIAAFARQYDVQVFATTHSEECVRAAHKAFGEDELYDFRLHRIDRETGELRAVTYDQEMLDTALKLGFEFR